MSLRFGLATLLAAGLLVISLAGWIKETLDAAREETALLAELSQAELRFHAQRRAPGIPWMFFSTDALPLDTPLKSIAFDAPPPPDAFDKLLRKSPAVDVVAGDQGVRTADDVALLSQMAALPDLVPRFPGYGEAPEAIDPLPTGKRLEGETRQNVIDMARESWASAARSTPRSYAVREEVEGIRIPASRVTFRDGDRYRLAEGGTGEVDAFDGRFFRRFQRTVDGWRLVSRRAPDRSKSEETAPSQFGRQYAGWEDDADQEWEGGGTFSLRSVRSLEADAGPPLTEVRLPRTPYCVPPCLDGVVPDLDAALRQITTEDVVSVQKIDLDRYRLDLLFPRDESENVPELPREQATEERPWVTEFAVVLRADLDWAVERCEYVDEFAVRVPVTQIDTPEQEEDVLLQIASGQAPERDVRRRRRIRISNVLDGSGDVPRYDAAGFVCERTDDDSRKRRIDGYAFYAVTFPGELPDALFDRPALTDPSPPVPESPPEFRWYFATAALGALVIAIGPALRRFGTARSRGATVAAEKSNEPTNEEAV